MNKKEPPILSPIKRIIFTVVLAIFLILFCFAYLQYQTRHRDYEDKLIINAFGKQRMYTQMMSKDASRLYSLILTKDSNGGYQPREEVRQEIASVKSSLTITRAKFSKTLEEIHDNKLFTNSEVLDIKKSLTQSSNYLHNIDYQWDLFDQQIEVLVSAEHMNREMSDATGYINEHNLDLLEQCDNLLNQILKDSLHQDDTMQILSYGLIGLLFAVILLAFIELQRYLIRPFGQLYKGLAEIGLNPYPLNSTFPTNNKMMPIVDEITNMFKKINSLISLIENINHNDSFMETLNFISNTFAPFIPYNYIGIALITEDKKYLKASYGVTDGTIVGLPEKIRGSSFLIEETTIGALINSGEARIINDLQSYCKDKPLKPYNKVILDAGIQASITLPLIVSGEPMGVIFFSSANKNVYTREHLNFLLTLANSIAICLNQNIFISDILYSSILALAKLAEARDEDTGDHLGRMTVYAKLIAELLYEENIYPEEITLEYIDNIKHFSPLHDIGKVGIRDGILLKPGKLTPEEFDEMKKHTVFGSEVLRMAENNMKKRGRSLFSMGFEIAESHHEKWDGSGYPHGKKEYEIPLCARIAALADVFDALTSKRPYKEAYSFEVSMGIIEEGRGKHFDPAIIDIIMKNRSRMEHIYLKYHALNKKIED